MQIDLLRCEDYHSPDAAQIVTIAAVVKGDESGGFQYAFSVDQMLDF